MTFKATKIVFEHVLSGFKGERVEEGKPAFRGERRLVADAYFRNNSAAVFRLRVIDLVWENMMTGGQHDEERDVIEYDDGVVGKMGKGVDDHDYYGEIACAMRWICRGDLTRESACDAVWSVWYALDIRAPLRDPTRKSITREWSPAGGRC